MKAYSLIYIICIFSVKIIFSDQDRIIEPKKINKVIQEGQKKYASENNRDFIGIRDFGDEFRASVFKKIYDNDLFFFEKGKSIKLLEGHVENTGEFTGIVTDNKKYYIYGFLSGKKSSEIELFIEKLNNTSFLSNKSFYRKTGMPKQIFNDFKKWDEKIFISKEGEPGYYIHPKLYLVCQVHLNNENDMPIQVYGFEGYVETP